MKILLTGSTGFIGMKMLTSLSKNKDYSLFALYRSDKKLTERIENVYYVQSDLTKILPVIECDVLIHIAGLASDQSTPEELYLNNVIATQNLIDSVSNCKKVIYISSSSVYNFEKYPICKEDNVLPNNFQSEYGRSKYHGEEIIYSCKIPQKFILRPRAVYGEGDTTLLPRILKMYKFGRIILPCKRRIRTSLTHIDNLVMAIELCIRKEINSCQVFNIADDSEYDLRQSIIEILNKKFEAQKVFNIPISMIRILTQFVKKIGLKMNLSEQALNYFMYDSILDISHAKRELEYCPKKSLKDFLTTIRQYT